MVVGLPTPSEDSRLKAKLESMISKFETKINSGRWQCYLTPDEEKLLVDIVEQRDLYGFGFDRKQLQVMAKRWCKRLGYKETDCGNRWFLGFMRRAKEYKPDFGESKRSKMDVMRAAKQSPEVIGEFFDMVDAIYEHGKKNGYFEGDGPAAEDIYNTDEGHANPESKHRKKLGSKRSKMGVMRAQKQSPEVIGEFFGMADAVYGHGKTNIVYKRSMLF